MRSESTLDRRQLMRLTAAGGTGLALGHGRLGRVMAQDAGTPQRGGVLRIALTEDPANLNPYGPGGAWAKRNVLRGIFDALIGYDQNGEWTPALAEAWEVAADGLTIDFALRQGVTFHDGTPCDGEAIKWVVDTLWLHPETGNGTLRAMFSAAELVDATTLRFTLPEPNVTAMARINTQMIVSPTAYQNLGPDEFGLNPVGTGPFAFVSWDKGSELVTERNEGYWNPERPYVDGITWVMLPEPTIRQINLTGGDVDIATFIPPSEVEGLRAEEGIEVGISVGGYSGAMFNHSDPPFDQLANREALLAAIDWEAVVGAVYFGLAEVSTGGFIPPSNYAFNASLPPHARDLDLARAKLAEAGNPDGFEFVATFEPGNQVAARLMEVIQATVAEVGITVNLEQYDRGRFSEIIQSDHRAVQLVQFDVAYIHLTPEQRLTLATCEANNNFAEWCNAEFEEALTEATASVDRAAEIEAVQRAEQIVIAEKPATTLVWLPFVHAWRSSVHDYGFDYAGDAGWQDAWLADA